MEKYTFTPSAEVRANATDDNGRLSPKTEADLSKLLNVILPRYGIVEPYTEPTNEVEQIPTSNYTDDLNANNAITNEDVFLINRAEYDELNNYAKEQAEKVITLEQELEFYAPAINVVKMFLANKDLTIEKLNAELLEKSGTTAELEKLKALLKTALGE